MKARVAKRTESNRKHAKELTACATEPAAFLVGVDHRIQYTNLACGPEWLLEIKTFKLYLKNQAADLNVDLLAEEFNEELVAKNSATKSTVRDAANQSGCRHLFCDPNRAERKEKRIDSNDQREMFWLERITASNARRVLFVCGNDHVNTFTEKLRNEGFDVSVLTCGWGRNWKFTQ
jgi:hypothetical protein